MGKSKPKSTRKPTTGGVKEIKRKRDPSENLRPVFSFADIDKDGKFAFAPKRNDFEIELVLTRLIEYSSMKWSAIRAATHGHSNKTKHHFLDYASLSKDAKDRIAIKQLQEQADAIFSFALNGKIRIIGIRKDEIFKIIFRNINIYLKIYFVLLAFIHFFLYVIFHFD